jgi:hypothetical protein
MTRPIQDTLDSSIRDVMGLLQKGDKIDVLLCTMERLPMNDKYVSQSHIGADVSEYSSESRSRTVIEIGVESFFRVTSVVQDCDKSVRAHLLRAKSRITAGLSHAALQGLVFRRLYVKRVHLIFFYPTRQICRLFSNSILITARLGTYCPILTERPKQRPEM